MKKFRSEERNPIHRCSVAGFKDLIPRLAACNLIACLLLFLSASDGNTQGTEPKKPSFTLQECIKRAVEVSPEIGETRYEEEIYKSKKLQADSAAFPQIEVFAITGPSPQARGNQVYSPDTTTSTTLNGIFGSADVTLIQPIYTFGKISGYKDAASSGVKVMKASTDKKTSDIVLRTKEIYYGLLLAKDMKNLALEIKDDLEDAIKKAEKQIEKGSPSADEINLFKLRAFLGQINKYINEADKGIALAKDALATSMGLPRGTDFDIEDSTLSPEDKISYDVANYIKNATEMRPEFIQLKEGLNAKNALIDVEKSNYYPQVFFGLKGSVASASNRDRVTNPFIYDYFNHSYGAVFLGFKWAIDFGIISGRVKEAEAEYYKIVEKKKFADEAIPLQVRKAYLEIQESEKTIIETQISYTNARKWLVAAIANFDMGVSDAKEIADAAIAYAQMKADNLRSIYNNRMSYANLLYATGMDLKEIK